MSHMYDSNCTLGDKCKTHGDTKELQESLLQLKDGETLEMGPSDHKFSIEQLVNGGAYGQIFLGELLANKTKVAVKVEKQGTGHEKLLYEGNVYRKLEGGIGIPKVHWFGMHGQLYNMLVMDLLGPSLNDLFEANEQHFSLKTVLMLIDQVLDIFKYIHKKGFFHRDISPSNFVMGNKPNDKDKVYVIDFGLSKRGEQPGMFTMTGRRSSFHVSHTVVGTPRYVSLSAHHGEEPTFHDDIEALSYMWVYLHKGSLPWQGLVATSYAEKLVKIAKKKASMNGREICEGIPDEFALNVDYCRNLKPHEFPNYKAMKQMFRDLAHKRGIVYDNEYDWDEDKQGQYITMRVRCESESTPKSLKTNKKIRGPYLLPQGAEAMDDITEASSATNG